jgi:hypothetical protein
MLNKQDEKFIKFLNHFSFYLSSVSSGLSNLSTEYIKKSNITFDVDSALRLKKIIEKTIKTIKINLKNAKFAKTDVSHYYPLKSDHDMLRVRLVLLIQMKILEGVEYELIDKPTYWLCEYDISDLEYLLFCL